MSNRDISIIVVDDAKFSSTLIERKLREAGYSDIRMASSAKEAMNLLHARPASIMMADWIMPEMDGLELTRKVREINLAKAYFTYVMLLTAKEGEAAIVKAFAEGVDDFISKTDLKTQLIPRTLAATRVSLMQNASLQRQKQLEEHIVKAQKSGMIDPVTHRGNSRFLLDRVNHTYRHVVQRGGSFCLLAFKVKNVEEIHSAHGMAVYKEILALIGNRISQLIRPLDSVARVSDNSFGVLMHQPEVQGMGVNSFKRLLSGLENKSYKTSVGYLSIQCSAAVLSVQPKDEGLSGKVIVKNAISLLNEAEQTGLFVFKELTELNQSVDTETI